MSIKFHILRIPKISKAILFLITFFVFRKDELLRGVYDMGFNAPSKIQEKALPLLLAEPYQNMIAQSQSGTGKTRIDPRLRCFDSAPAFV